MIRLLSGDCRETLSTLDSDSVQAVITSPPYYGLRSYIADGDPLKPFEIGLEPTPDLYIEHMVEVFRHVRRVLRPDGVLWLNLGDSYAGSGIPPSGSNGIPGQSDRQGWEGSRRQRIGSVHGESGHTSGVTPPAGYKPKDLMMMPFRVAMALQADGWWLRSVIPWLKRNAMPESVTDRPATSVEYVFLLSRSARYFWDADAVRVPHAEPWRSTGAVEKMGTGNAAKAGQNQGFGLVGERPREYNPAGRNRRNGDWFFESWQGLLGDEDGDPLALVVNPQPFKGSHFATFPPKLVEPMIKASTSEKGQCPECGAPWVRQSTAEYLPTERKPPPNKGQIGAMGERAANLTRDGWIPNRDPVRTTTGWQPSCAHAGLEPVPQTVLDCFFGAGTVGLVADRLRRNAIGCELKPDYAEMAVDRVTNDAPMFAELESA